MGQTKAKAAADPFAPGLWVASRIYQYSLHYDMRLDTQIYTARYCDPLENIVIRHIESSREEGVEGMRIDETKKSLKV